jgi:DNA-binding XRE family transcriptional regulator
MTQRARKLVDALLEWRARDRKSQVDAAKMLSVARKTYLFLEAGSWLPPVREQHFFAHTLASVDPQLGEAFARACGTTGEALGLAKPAPAPLLAAVQARTTYDAAVYSAAEEADVPAKTARILVAAVIARLREAGVTMGQAEDCGRHASSARPPGLGSGDQPR